MGSTILLADAAKTTYWDEIKTPIGPLLLAGSSRGLSCVGFQAGPRPMRAQPHWVRSSEPFTAAVAQLAAYFKGSLRIFDLALAPRGTPFQLAVWEALRLIPYGETLSYGELARRLGHPQGARAVGLANGANPLPIIVPCHRVIGADGSLTGFGGGLPIKRALLGLEGAACVADLFSAGARPPLAPSLERAAE
jgi:methylated-DNA-[protein]-cysteine S-methyltransferase